MQYERNPNYIIQELLLRLKAGLLSPFQLYNNEALEQYKLYF